MKSLEQKLAEFILKHLENQDPQNWVDASGSRGKSYTVLDGEFNLEDLSEAIINFLEGDRH